MQTMNIFKKIGLSVSLLLIVITTFAPISAGAISRSRPGESRVCFGVGNTIIDLSGLPCFAGICLQADLEDGCRRLGGTYGVMPQYTGPARTNAPVQDVNDFLQILTDLVRLAQMVFWIFAVGFGLYAAYLYLFSGGSKESVSQAHKMLIYTAVASLVAILAYGIPGIIDSFF